MLKFQLKKGLTLALLLGGVIAAAVMQLSACCTPWQKHYESEYINSVFSGLTSEGVRINLVAGTHNRNFPYYGDDPWDNVLLSTGDEYYEITARPGLVRFNLNLGPEEGTITASLYIDGYMRAVKASKKAQVVVQVKDMTIAVLKPREEARPLNFVCKDKTPGMRWHPYVTKKARAEIRVNDRKWSVENLVGEIEHGKQLNLQDEKFAFYYDYQVLVRPEAAGPKDPSGYVYVWFETHAIDRGKLGRILDRFLVDNASEELTLQDGVAFEGNRNGVGRRPREDPSPVLFENTVQLVLATLHRQIVQTRDREGALVLYPESSDG